MRRKPFAGTPGLIACWLLPAIGMAARIPLPPQSEGSDDTSIEEAAAEPPVPWLDLLPDPTDAEVALALAILEVRRGCARLALTRLEELLAGEDALDDALVARIGIERERIGRWLALRESFIDHQIAAGERVSLDHGGEKLRARVLGRDGDLLRLDQNRRACATLSLEDVPSIVLAQGMSRGGKAYKSSWVRFYPYAIAGDARWETLLRDRGEEAEAFRADVQVHYPVLLERAAIVAELGGLSRTAPPRDFTRADATLARIGWLRAEHGSDRIVVEKREPLRSLAGAALSTCLETLGLDGILRGRVEELGKGRVRLTYDFDEAEQLDDFTEDRDYLASLRYGAGVLSEGTETDLKVNGGAVVGVGSTCLRNRVVLEAPLRIRYRVEFRQKLKKGEETLNFMLGVLDDGRGSFAGSLGFGNLLVRDKVRGHEARAWDAEGLPFRHGQVYSLELQQDEEGILRYLIDGEVRCEVDCGKLRSGSFLLWWHTDARIAFHNVEIEGAMTPPSRAALEEAWIESQLLRLGID
jgi:hypothetical protein